MITPLTLRLRAALLLLAATFAIRSRYRQRFLNPPVAGTGSVTAETITAAMRDALHWHPFRFTCLERAGALHRLLHAYGHPSFLRIGVKSDPSPVGIAAHAWVEHPAGQVLLDEEYLGFLVLDSPNSPKNRD